MSDVINVSSTEELYEALATCQGGETILLAPGDYGDLSLSPRSGFDIVFPENVTIASADPENPATFDTLYIDSAQNLTLDGIYFDYTFAEGDAAWYRPFDIWNSSNISVVNCTFDGDLAQGVSETDDGYAWGYGLAITNCNDVTIANSEFFEFKNGMVVSDTDNIDVIANEIHSIRTDGMNFIEVTNVVISENYIHDFAGSPNSADHCDMIQFWTSGTDEPSTNIVIENNILDIGDGTPTQSIFMRNELVDLGLAGDEMFYQNISVTDNVIVNAHSHGITVGATDGLLIENNTVVHADGGNADGLDSSVEIPVIYAAAESTNVTISQNVTSNIIGYDGQPGWTFTSNVYVQDQDPNGTNYYGDVFITSTLTPESGVHSFVAVPGGVIEQTGAGASSTTAPEIDGVVEAHFQVAATADNAAVRHFDASLTLTDLESLPEGTTYTWDFGDGTTATGLQVSHAFPDGGVYPVTLTVTLPDGTSDSQAFDVGIQGPTLVCLSDGLLQCFDMGEADTVAVAGGVIDIPDTGAGMTIGRQHFIEVEAADDVEIRLSIQGNSTQNAGEILRLHMSFIMTVNADGELTVTILNPDGAQHKITTEGAGLDDLDTHDIVVHMSGEILEINVDGQVLATGQAPGGMGYSGSHDLTFGNPWGSPNYDGSVSSLEISANGDDFAEANDPTFPEEPAPEEPIEEPAPEDPIAEEPAPEEPVEEPAPEDPIAEEPAPEEPVEEPSPKEPPGKGNSTNSQGWLKKFLAMMETMASSDDTAKEIGTEEPADSSTELDKMAFDEDTLAAESDSFSA